MRERGFSSTNNCQKRTPLLITKLRHYHGRTHDGKHLVFILLSLASLQRDLVRLDCAFSRDRHVGTSKKNEYTWLLADGTQKAWCFVVLGQIHLTASCTRDMTRVFTVTKSNLYSLATTNHPSQGRHRRIARQGPVVIQYQCLLCSRRHCQDHSGSSWYG